MTLGSIFPNNFFAPIAWVKSMLAFSKIQPFQFIYHEGSTLHHNRNMVIEKAKLLNDDLIFIDSDIVFSLDQLLTLKSHLENGYDIVSGVYTLFDRPDAPAILKRVSDGYTPMKPVNGLQEIGACGMGFCAISKRVIEVIGAEPFNPFQEGNVQHGEDVSFCHRARLLGFKVWCDGDLKVGQVRVHESYPQL